MFGPQAAAGRSIATDAVAAFRESTTFFLRQSVPITSVQLEI